MVQLSVIIPVYNEQDNILKLHERLLASVTPLNISFEFLFVNDGSKDQSMAIVKTLAQQNSYIKYIDFSRNFGHQVAVSAGLDHVKGSRIVIIDADLQDPPELIVPLYQKMDEGFQVVYAKRNKRKGETFLKKWTAGWFYRVLHHITNINIPVDTGDFRIMDNVIVDVLKQMPERHKFIRGQISWAGYNQTFLTYDRDERNAGKTAYTYRKMIRFALDGITAFSTAPLKFATFLGFTVSVIAFLTSLYALYQKFVNQDVVQGWTSIMLVVLFLGGVQLICLGVIGEYIARMNTDIKQRPLYIIKEHNC